MTFKVKPTAAFKMAGTSITLDTWSTYWAVHATNLPDWRDTRSVYLQVKRDGSPSSLQDADSSFGFLLRKGDYTLVATRGDTHYELRANSELWTTGEHAYLCGYVSDPDNLDEAIDNHEAEMNRLFAGFTKGHT